MLLLAGSSLPSWFGLAANSHCWQCVEKLPVLRQVAISTERHEIRERIVTLLVPLHLVVDL